MKKNESLKPYYIGISIFLLSVLGIFSGFVLRNRTDSTQNSTSINNENKGSYVQSSSQPISANIGKKIDIEGLITGMEEFYEEFAKGGSSTPPSLDIDTERYPGKIRIVYRVDGQNVCFGTINLLNSDYDNGKGKNQSGFDYIEYEFRIPSSEVSYSDILNVWASECAAIFVGMSYPAYSDTFEEEFSEADRTIREVFENGAPESGFSYGTFEIGDVKYAARCIQKDKSEVHMILQAGNKETSFGIFKTMDTIADLASKL